MPKVPRSDSAPVDIAPTKAPRTNDIYTVLFHLSHQEQRCPDVWTYPTRESAVNACKALVLEAAESHATSIIEDIDDIDELELTISSGIIKLKQLEKSNPLPFSDDECSSSFVDCGLGHDGHPQDQPGHFVIPGHFLDFRSFCRTMRQLHQHFKQTQTLTPWPLTFREAKAFLRLDAVAAVYKSNTGSCLAVPVFGVEEDEEEEE